MARTTEPSARALTTHTHTHTGDIASRSIVVVVVVDDVSGGTRINVDDALRTRSFSLYIGSFSPTNRRRTPRNIMLKYMFECIIRSHHAAATLSQ